MPEITPDHLADSAGPNLSSSQGIGNTGGATYDFLRFLVPFAHHVQSMYNWIKYEITPRMYIWICANEEEPGKVSVRLGAKSSWF